MGFLDAFSQMLVILFTIAMGYLAHRLHILGKDVDQKLSKLLLYFTMPAMIFSAVAAGDTLPDRATTLSVLGAAVVFYGMEGVFALVIPPLLGGTAREKSIWRFGLAFPNVGFIGFPVVTAIFGQGALFYAAVLNLPFNLLSFTLGPLILTGAGRFRWKQLCSPCVVASVLALIVALTGWLPPALPTKCLSFLGSATVPLSLTVVGSLLAELPAGQVLKAPRIWGLAALRLLILPAVLCLLLRLMGFAPVVVGVSTLLISMPVAVNGSLLCIEYGGDSETMARATFLTTLVSMLTIPCVVAVLL